MHICILADGFPSENIQSFVFVEQLTNALAEQGVHISVIAPQSVTKSLIRHVDLLPTQSEKLTKTGASYQVYRPKFFSVGNNKLLSPIADYSRSNAINKAMKQIGIDNIDILYGHFWHNTFALWKLSRKSKKPLFVACGEGDNALEDLVASMPDHELKEFAKAVNGVISVSTENKNKCIKYGLSKDENTIVLPNCVDQSIFHPLDKIACRKELDYPQDAFIAIFVGGLIHRKGSKRVAEAIKELNNPSIKSIFIGKHFGGDSAIPDCEGILHLGPVRHDELPKYLSAADVFVLPTLKEGCCNAIVEALSCGLPVISSNGTFNDDILDESCSIRIDPMSIEELKAAIDKIVKSPDLRETLSKGAVNKTKSSSIELRAERIRKFIENQVAKNEE